MAQCAERLACGAGLLALRPMPGTARSGGSPDWDAFAGLPAGELGVRSWGWWGWFCTDGGMGGGAVFAPMEGMHCALPLPECSHADVPAALRCAAACPLQVSCPDWEFFMSRMERWSGA